MHMAIQFQVLQNKIWVLSFDSGRQRQLLVSFFCKFYIKLLLCTNSKKC